MSVRHRQLARPYLMKNFYEDELPIIYINRSTGSDSNDGLTPTTAKLSLDGAKAIMTSVGARVLISGTTLSSFVQGFTDFTQGTVILEGLNGVEWHCERTLTLVAGGWTSSGGGIYHRSGTTSSGSLWYSSLPDSNGFSTILTQNVSTPTTPSAGEFGYSTNELYVHLPGDANANSYEFKRASTSYLVQASGTCNLTIRNMTASYSNGSIVQLTSANAKLTVENSLLRYGGNGISESAASKIVCKNVISQKQTNDGFNCNNGSWILYNCEGSYNLDEGVSPHNSCILNIYNSWFHHNGHGGCTAINSSVMNINNSITEFNGVTGQAGIEANGINYANTASGAIINTIARNNDRSGFYCTSSGTVTFSNFSTGTGNNNLQADTLC